MKIWWRDDDAGRWHQNFELLLQLAEQTNAPICLAIVPAWLDDRTVEMTNRSKNSCVVQHGWMHKNNALPGRKKIELGGSATPQSHRILLKYGLARLRAVFPEKFHAVMTPPWNRIDAEHRALVEELGYKALSTFDGAQGTGQCNAPVVVDTHIDAIAWKEGKRTKTMPELQQEVQSLIDRGEHTFGFLTHHLDHSPTDFDALARFIHWVQTTSGIEWASLPELLEDELAKQCPTNTRP